MKIIIYFIVLRAIVRSLTTILLFFAIPNELSAGEEFQGVLLFVILASCIIMSWGLINQKNKLEEALISEEENPLEDELEFNEE